MEEEVEQVGGEKLNDNSKPNEAGVKRVESEVRNITWHRTIT